MLFFSLLIPCFQLPVYLGSCYFWLTYIILQLRVILYYSGMQFLKKDRPWMATQAHGNSHKYTESRWAQVGQSNLPSVSYSQPIFMAMPWSPLNLVSQLPLCEMRGAKLSLSHLKAWRMDTLRCSGYVDTELKLFHQMVVYFNKKHYLHLYPHCNHSHQSTELFIYFSLVVSSWYMLKRPVRQPPQVFS